MVKLILFLTLPLISLAALPPKVLFADRPPVKHLLDTLPIPLPQKNKFDFIFYGFDVLVRQPILNSMRFAPSRLAGDVNSHDHIIASSWYTPRLGYQDISPERLLKGPAQMGPPQAPYTVVKAKKGGGNPGFIISDKRGLKYLIKFDPPNFPGIETSTALIVNRLFWGFGYNVPEDYIFEFKTSELALSPDGELKQKDLDEVFSSVAPPVNQTYRSTASLFLNGKILGPILKKGNRPKDANDKIPNQDRRILRALKVFCAFTNQSGFRVDNSLDVYVGGNFNGYVKHYLLDFGEAMGGHGASHDRMWDGYEHWFDFGDMFSGILGLGLRKKKWEDIKLTPWNSVGAFEGDVFSPELWKVTWKFPPFEKGRPDDNYWAAKIIAGLKSEHLSRLIQAAKYPAKEIEAYLLNTFLKRQKKIVQYYCNKVTPLEFTRISRQHITLTDITSSRAGNKTMTANYFFEFQSEIGTVLHSGQIKQNSGEIVSIPIGGAFKKEKYIILKIQKKRGEGSNRHAEFHFIQNRRSSRPVLIGVLH